MLCTEEAHAFLTLRARGLDAMKMFEHQTHVLRHLPQKFPRVAHHVFAMRRCFEVPDELPLALHPAPLFRDQLLTRFDTMFHAALSPHTDKTMQTEIGSRAFLVPAGPIELLDLLAAGARSIGIDEIAIRKGHSYCVVVSDLHRKSADLVRRRGSLRGQHGAVLCLAEVQKEPPDRVRRNGHMWKPFRNVAREKAPQAAILFDKFHIMRHLGEALDKVRKSEYARFSGKDRRFIKGQK